MHDIEVKRPKSFYNVRTEPVKALRPFEQENDVTTRSPPEFLFVFGGNLSQGQPFILLLAFFTVSLRFAGYVEFGTQFRSSYEIIHTQRLGVGYGQVQNRLVITFGR